MGITHDTMILGDENCIVATARFAQQAAVGRGLLGASPSLDIAHPANEPRGTPGGGTRLCHMISWTDPFYAPLGTSPDLSTNAQHCHLAEAPSAIKALCGGNKPGSIQL